jgi:hypothetical protein
LGGAGNFVYLVSFPAGLYFYELAALGGAVACQEYDKWWNLLLYGFCVNGHGPDASNAASGQWEFHFRDFIPVTTSKSVCGIESVQLECSKGPWGTTE